MIEKPEEALIRLEELNQKLSEPDVIADRAKWQEFAKEHAVLSEMAEVYHRYEALNQQIAEAEELLSGDDAELRKLAEEELKEARPAAADCERQLTELLAPRDPSDDKNVVLEIRAGTGGEEAALFAADLLRMYQRYAERKGWSFEITSVNDTEIGGIKEVTCLVTGKEVFRHLKYESGAHRVQRVPVTESGGRIHTSAATVAVLPEAEDVDIEIRPEDLLIETHRSSGAGGQHINKTESADHMVHLPTGIEVDCQDERSQIKNREKAMKVLKSRVLDFYQRQADAEYSGMRRAQIGSGDRSERIRTYNFPQGRVTDHRIGMTLYKLDAFLEGDMDEMLAALILARGGSVEEAEE
ncbi:MAG: peptide chain release factor 1 [Clostridia bacterium]|nr:peptide chain release factor 1 [Clostridia bacterium]